MNTNTLIKNKRGLFAKLAEHWTTKDLITIGVFAAVIKASTVLVAFIGGGMNPLSLIAKNVLFTTLCVVLFCKVPRIGTLTLFSVLSFLVSFVLLGQSMLNIPGAIVSCFFAELLILIFGGYKNIYAVMMGIILFDLLSKAISLLFFYLAFREQPMMVIGISSLIGVGTLGTFIGVFTGKNFVKELHRAGIVN